MIIISEPVHFGDTHVQVNSAIIALFRETCKDQPMHLIAEKKHIEAIKENAPDKITGITYTAFSQYSQPGRFYWLQKIAGEWRQIIRVLRTAQKNEAALIVWLCLFPTGQLFLQILNALWFRKQKQLLVLHGELEYLENQHAKRSDRLLGKILRMSFALSSQYMRYMVLGKQVKRNIEALPVKAKERFFTFPHPFLYQAEKTPRKDKNLLPLKVCCFGAMRKEKNAHLFFVLAERFSREIEKGQVTFTMIGKCAPALQEYKNQWVRQILPGTFLPQTILEGALAEQDLALFFYDKSMYRFCASGALHEALNQRLAVISLYNEYFATLSEETGTVRCVDKLEEMETLLRKAIAGKVNGEREFQEAFSTFIQQNSFLLQSHNFKTALEQAGILPA